MRVLVPDHAAPPVVSTVDCRSPPASRRAGPANRGRRSARRCSACDGMAPPVEALSGSTDERCCGCTVLAPRLPRHRAAMSSRPTGPHQPSAHRRDFLTEVLRRTRACPRPATGRPLPAALSAAFEDPMGLLATIPRLSVASSSGHERPGASRPSPGSSCDGGWRGTHGGHRRPSGVMASWPAPPALGLAMLFITCLELAARHLRPDRGHA